MPEKQDNPSVDYLHSEFNNFRGQVDARFVKFGDDVSLNFTKMDAKLEAILQKYSENQKTDLGKIIGLMFTGIALTMGLVGSIGGLALSASNKTIASNELHVDRVEERVNELRIGVATVNAELAALTAVVVQVNSKGSIVHMERLAAENNKLQELIHELENIK